MDDRARSLSDGGGVPVYAWRVRYISQPQERDRHFDVRSN